MDVAYFSTVYEGTKKKERKKRAKTENITL